MSLREGLTGLLRRFGLMGVANATANAWFRLLKAIYRWRGKSYVEAIYSAKYFDAEEQMTLDSAEDVVEILCEELQPVSVADVGCGTAVYLAAFEARVSDIQGFEWSPAAIERARIDRSRIRQQDLREPLEHSGRYDLVLCFEVAEHLPGEFARRLVENICSLGATVAFSAAQPGQGGTDHINEQPAEYWIRHFAALGYGLVQGSTDRLRRRLRERGAVWWLPQNLLLFRRNLPEAPEGNSPP